MTALAGCAGCRGASTQSARLRSITPKDSTTVGSPDISSDRADTRGPHVIHFVLASRLLGRSVPEAGLIPASHSNHPRPLLVLLHALQGGPASTLNEAVVASDAALGSDAPDIVSPFSPDASYWHNRAGQPPHYFTRGAWASYVVDEVIPRAIAILHADPHRIAIAGNSMGGFGALDIARLHPNLFCAVAAHSPALFTSYTGSQPLTGAESGPDNFDNAADFARHDLLRAAAQNANLYGNAHVWIDAGTLDPHASADKTFTRLIARAGSHVQLHIWPGEHTEEYWMDHQQDYFRFYAAALGHCTTR